MERALKASALSSDKKGKRRDNKQVCFALHISTLFCIKAGLNKWNRCINMRLCKMRLLRDMWSHISCARQQVCLRRAQDTLGRERAGIGQADSSNSLSAINAMNSPLVGFSLGEYIFMPKMLFMFSILPLFHATSIACRIALSTFEAEVP